MAKAISSPGRSSRGRKPSEDGYMLLAVIFMMVLLVLSLAVAAPRIAKSIQRDREVETMYRGKQYIRAIQLYYRKMGSYPPSIDALVNTNNIKFLRKKYIDPMTGKSDWKPILFGQNKAPLAMGFFGQPLGGGGTPIAGIGPGGSAGTGLGAPAGSPTGSGIGSGSGSSLGGGSSFGSSTFGSSGSSFGSSGSSSPFGSSPSGTDSSGSAAGSTGSDGSSGSDSAGANAGAGATGTGPPGAGAAGGSATGTGGTGFMSGQNGPSFGGGGIIGVEPVLAKPSILIYKKKDHYNQWEFTYSPLVDMMQQAGGNAGIGQPAAGMPGATGTTGSGSGFGSTGSSGSSFGGSSFGGSSFGGSSPGGSGPGGSSSGSSFGGSTFGSPGAGSPAGGTPSPQQ